MKKLCVLSLAVAASFAVAEPVERVVDLEQQISTTKPLMTEVLTRLAINRNECSGVFEQPLAGVLTKKLPQGGYAIVTGGRLIGFNEGGISAQRVSFINGCVNEVIDIAERVEKTLKNNALMSYSKLTDAIDSEIGNMILWRTTDRIQPEYRGEQHKELVFFVTSPEGMNKKLHVFNDLLKVTVGNLVWFDEQTYRGKRTNIQANVKGGVQLVQ